MLHLSRPFYRCLPLACKTRELEIQVEGAEDTGARDGGDSSHHSGHTLEQSPLAQNAHRRSFLALRIWQQL